MKDEPVIEFSNCIKSIKMIDGTVIAKSTDGKWWYLDDDGSYGAECENEHEKEGD